MPRAALPSGRKLLLLLALAAAIIGGVWWWQRPPPDPVYNGRRLSERLKAWAMRAPDGPKVDEIRAFGPAAIPWLAHRLEHGQRLYEDNPGPFKKAPNWLRGWVPYRWGGLRDVPPLDEREVAAVFLTSFGPDAAPALPALARTLKHNEGSKYIAETLLAIGPGAWPTILDALEHDGDKAQCCLLYFPNLIEETPETDLPRVAAVIVRICHESDSDSRRVAAGAIARLRTQRPDTTLFDAAIPDLVQMLSNDEPYVMHAAAMALESLGENGIRGATPTIPFLIEQLDTPSAWLRSYTALALGCLDKGEKRSATRLQTMLKDSDISCRRNAAHALKDLGLMPAEEAARLEGQ